jgi:hypothetical protein
MWGKKKGAKNSFNHVVKSLVSSGIRVAGGFLLNQLIKDPPVKKV